ncbi:hypothetical protein I3842_02G143600 [Carya illinoinensis]|uniref:Uncharacterized protein n=1 Tax=Carya illinoinensis TaxID=32201 RepID=A0A922FSU7_CARIL|nr:hypothetical protein I3842_02G143600 [Carya illinoinensis]
MLRQKHMNPRRQTNSCPSSYSNSGQCIPPVFITLYVGQERKCFLILTQFLNLLVFVGLLKKTEEELGFFEKMLKLLEIDENGFRGLGLDDFLKLVLKIGSESCNEATSSSFHMATPLLQKARV